MSFKLYGPRVFKRVYKKLKRKAGRIVTGSRDVGPAPSPLLLLVMSDFAQSNSDFASPPTPFSSSSTIYQGIASPVGIDARGCASSSGASSRMSINLKSSISTMVTKVKEGGAKIMNKINNTGKDDHDNSCEMSLNEIMDEIDEILVKVNSDQAYDADRLERLSELLEDNPEVLHSRDLSRIHLSKHN